LNASAIALNFLRNHFLFRGVDLQQIAVALIALPPQRNDRVEAQNASAVGRPGLLSPASTAERKKEEAKE
jgi:hypothetical protein